MKNLECNIMCETKRTGANFCLTVQLPNKDEVLGGLSCIFRGVADAMRWDGAVWILQSVESIPVKCGYLM